MAARWLGVTAVALAALLASGCLRAGPETRPTPKPEGLAVAVKTGGTLAPARVSTKSGDILILEPDGKVTTMALDSAGGRDAFDVSEADLAALNVNMSLDLSKVAPEDPAGTLRSPSGPSAQERALAAFRARTQPALPALPSGLKIEPKDFRGATVAPMRRDGERGNSGLVQVSATLREGVDAEVAIAYATCALARWAADTGTPYARHVRTLTTRRNGQLQLESVFTLSKASPLGLKVMAAKATTDECQSRGIPAA